MMAAERLKGLGELIKAFNSLAEDMKKGGARRIAAAGGAVLRKEARVIAQSKGLRKTGALIKNIVIKRERDVPAGTEQYNLGVRHGRDLGKKYKQLTRGKNGRIRVDYKNNPYYWIFLEFGHRIVARKTGQTGGGITAWTQRARGHDKNGRILKRSRAFSNASLTGRRKNSKGFVDATPFIRPALENKRHEALAAMEKQAIKEVQKAKK
jgi:HK97 gp10 family phage protein